MAATAPYTVAGATAIELVNVTRTYGNVAALRELSFAVRPGEVVGVLGPNGSGKTTLMRLVSACIAPSRGRVRVAGFDSVREALEVRRRVGYASEGLVLYPELTVDDFLGFAAAIKRVSRSEREEVVERLGLADWSHRRIGTLSKGYRQRLVLAQATLGNPPVLLLDEPTVGLDPEMAVRIRRHLRTLGGSTTVLLSTHSLGEARLVCDRLLVLHRGRMLAEGDAETLLPSGEGTLDEIFVRLLSTAGGEAEAQGS